MITTGIQNIPTGFLLFFGVDFIDTQFLPINQWIGNETVEKFALGYVGLGVVWIVTALILRKKGKLKA